MHTGSCLWQVNSWAFSLQPMRGRPLRTSTTHKEENLRRVSVIIFKISSLSYIKEANKKLIIVQDNEMLLKYLENHQRIHRKLRIKCLNLEKISISWRCPFEDFERNRHECNWSMKDKLVYKYRYRVTYCILS